MARSGLNGSLPLLKLTQFIQVINTIMSNDSTDGDGETMAFPLVNINTFKFYLVLIKIYITLNIFIYHRYRN